MPELSTWKDLFVKELRDIYDAEKQLTKALPKMAKAAESDELRSAFEEHREQTLGQIERIEQVFEMLGERAKSIPCKGMKGLVEEGSEIMQEDGEGAVLDAGLIGAAQKVEHYEIAAYGTLITYANLMGNEDIGDLLGETLNEEKETDERLTSLAKEFVNPQAEHEGDEQESGQMRGSARSRSTAANRSRGATSRSRSSGRSSTKKR
jgi:ferritin-like metal-binding protein YciE